MKELGRHQLGIGSRTNLMYVYVFHPSRLFSLLALAVSCPVPFSSQVFLYYIGSLSTHCLPRNFTFLPPLSSSFSWMLSHSGNLSLHEASLNRTFFLHFSLLSSRSLALRPLGRDGRKNFARWPEPKTINASTALGAGQKA